MKKKWFLLKDNVEQGPLSWDQLIAKAKKGLVSPDDLVWAEGMEEWVKAGYVEGIIPAASAPPPPPSFDRADSSDDLREQKVSAIPQAGGRKSPLKIIALTSGIILIVAVILLFAFKGLNLFNGQEKETALPGPEAFSSDQAKLYSNFGRPEHFIVAFEQNEDGDKRLEVWSYSKMNYYYTFLDGDYIEGSRIILPKYLPPVFDNLLPIYFQPWMKPGDIDKLLGEEGIEEMEPINNLKYYIYGGGEFISLFDENNVLMAVYCSPLPAEEVASR